MLSQSLEPTALHREVKVELTASSELKQNTYTVGLNFFDGL